MLIHSHAITFRELPKHTSLVLNISECPFKCRNCHTPELQLSSGVFLTKHLLRSLIKRYEGITAVVFMGGDHDKENLIELLQEVRDNGLITCLYTGARKLPRKLSKYLDYVKLGQYQEDLGALDSPKTNQVFLNVETGEVLNHLFLPKTILI